MPTIRISNTNVSKIQLPGKGQYCLYWDDQLAGFGVRALPSGLVYIVQRRIGGRDGRTVRVTVGKHGEISASKARDMAAEALANLRKGSDLNQIKQQEQKAKHIKALTLGQAYNEFIESRTLRPRTLQTYSYILNYTLSGWLNLPITDITAEMVLKKHKEISFSGIGVRGAGSANQVMRLLRTVFNYVISVKKDAVGKSIVSENPVKVLSSLGSWNKLQPRNNIVKVEDLQLWYETVMKLENEKMQDFFLFLMFSGLRRNEAACLQWKDVDTNTKILTIRAEISKTKIKRELPLPDILLNILKRRRAKIIVGNP